MSADFGIALPASFASTCSTHIDNVVLNAVDGAGGVPEPASWALLIAGFGLTGAAMRRQRASAAIA